MISYYVRLDNEEFKFESACEAMQFAQMAITNFAGYKYRNGTLDVIIKLVVETEEIENANSAESVENKEEN